MIDISTVIDLFNEKVRFGTSERRREFEFGIFCYKKRKLALPNVEEEVLSNSYFQFPRRIVLKVLLITPSYC